jgi:hypothetical protein
MKRVLIISMVICALAGVANAQCIQMGLGLGGNCISAPDHQDKFRETTVRWAPVVAASLKYRLRHYLQFGLEVSRVDFVRQRDVNTHDTSGNEIVQNQRIYAGSPAWMFGLTVAYQKQDFYCGLQAGLVNADRGGTDFSSAKSVRTYLDGYSGWTAGGHVGYDWRLGERLYLFTEYRLHFVQAEASSQGSRPVLNFWSNQLMVGLRCNFPL